jgi:hypothetical protein
MPRPEAYTAAGRSHRAGEPIPMRTTILTQFPMSPDRNARKPLRRRVQPPLTALAAIVLFASSSLAAQAPATSPATAQAKKPIHRHAHSSAAHPAIPPAQTVFAPVTPPAPAPPNWPANDHPTQASVVWNSQGLRISAANSSLQQILDDVSTATGTKVEGLAADVRVFGAYGPGQARDVLSQLLLGSGYNVLMIGDQGQGTPRQILLSARHTGDSPPAAANRQNPTNEDDSDADDQPEPEPPSPPMRTGFTPGDSPRSSQSMMQEMQQRRLEMQMQQPNEPQSNNPQNQ